MRDNSAHSELIAALSDVKNIGRYQIVRELGQGASAIVFQGYDPCVKRFMASNVSQPKSDRAIERLFAEARYAGQLNHQNLVGICDVGIYEGFSFGAIQFLFP